MARTVRRRKERKYETEVINGIKIVYLTEKKDLPKPVLDNLHKIIKVLNEPKYRGKFKKIEVGTIAAFWFEGKRTGRFIPLGISHMARLLKR